MNKTIGILGCGWLGTALAEELLSCGFTIKGSSTSNKKLKVLSDKGIQPFLVKLNQDEVEGQIEDFLQNLDVLIINVPPNLRNNPKSDYVKKMELLKECIKKQGVAHILFVSSTSVYGNIKGDITEETIPLPSTNSGIQLLKSEELFINDPSFSTSIIRFGGLIGENRHPVNHLSSKELTNGEELVNLIHRKDCIHMIKTIIRNSYWNEVFNGVYPYHPTKADYYTSEAEKRGLPPPIYKRSSGCVSKKRVIFRNFYVKNHLLTTSISS